MIEVSPGYTGGNGGRAVKDVLWLVSALFALIFLGIALVFLVKRRESRRWYLWSALWAAGGLILLLPLILHVVPVRWQAPEFGAVRLVAYQEIPGEPIGDPIAELDDPAAAETLFSLLEELSYRRDASPYEMFDNQMISVSVFLDDPAAFLRVSVILPDPDATLPKGRVSLAAVNGGLLVSTPSPELLDFVGRWME